MIYNETKYNKEWNTKKLDTLGKFARGKSKHRPRNDKKLFEGGGYPLVQTAEVKEANLLIRKHSSEYNEFGLKQSKLWDAGTLCITIAANIAETAILKYPMCFPDSVVGFNAYPTETTELFMHYVFTFIKQSIQKSVGGSVQDNINLEYLQNLDFKIPNKSYQDMMVQVLSAIDKRIELDTQLSEELDDLGRLVYNYWFVQFEFPNVENKPYRFSDGKMVWNERLKREIPEKWEVVTLEAIVENITSSVTPDEMMGKEMEHYSIPAYDEYRFPSFEESSEIESNKYKVSKNMILVSKLNPQFKRIWDPFCYTGNAICSTEFLTLVPRNIDNRPYCYALANSDEFSLYMKSKATSSTGSRKRIQPEVCMEYSFALPPQNVIDAFNDFYRPIMTRQKRIIEEKYQLSKLRDWLLPLLMNGQVTVKDKAK